MNRAWPLFAIVGLLIVASTASADSRFQLRLGCGANYDEGLDLEGYNFGIGVSGRLSNRFALTLDANADHLPGLYLNPVGIFLAGTEFTLVEQARVRPIMSLGLGAGTLRTDERVILVPGFSDWAYQEPEAQTDFAWSVGFGFEYPMQGASIRLQLHYVDAFMPDIQPYIPLRAQIAF